MAFDRPTFSETWYRVSQLKPRLRPRVQVFRQHFRGRTWHVVRDPSNNQFFRVDDAGYYFVGMLNGKRAVSEIWNACNDRLGDRAPTQGEVIQLLGQLYSSNLLQADLPPDAEGMFERYRKRVRREVGGYFSNVLFLRVPLIDPDRFLDRWLPLVRWAFTPVGFVLWLLLIGLGVRAVADRADEFFAGAQNILDPANLVLLYLSFALIKGIHELGHGFACKAFGERGPTGGEVHTIGIMFLVFMPVPYVDASSAWAFRSRLHRAIVGAGGMYVELAVAAVAAMVWAGTSAGSAVHGLAYNIIFVAGVTTILFNGNPLIRFDGYYILSDLLEVPNLYQRSRDYIFYLVKRYVYRAKSVRNPAHTPGEKFWLSVYAVCSGIYRIFLYAAILLFVADKLFFLGIILAAIAVAMWVLKPLGKWAKYLATSGEIARTRAWSVGVTVAVLLAIGVGVGAIPVTEYARVSGVVEPARLVQVHAEASGFLVRHQSSGSRVRPEGPPLVIVENKELLTRRDELAAERKAMAGRLRIARTEEPATAQALRIRMATLAERIEELESRIASLQVHAPFEGRWIAPDLERLQGGWVRRGQTVGTLASTETMLIRGAAGQGVGSRLEAVGGVEIRPAKRPSLTFAGSFQALLPAGQWKLPSPALGHAVGGPIAVDPEDREGRRAIEPFYEVRVRPAPEARRKLMPGQRVVMRFDLGKRPLAVQWYHQLRQLLQRRFQI